MLETQFALKPSKFYIFLILLMFSSSIGITFLLDWHLRSQIILCLGIVSYGVYTLYRYALLRHPESIQCLIYRKGNAWELMTPREILQAQLMKDSTVTAWVSILRFQIKGRRLPITAKVFRDSLKSVEYRQLMVTINMA